ncbi:beta-galactosidase, partial [bacterium]|nr:beta-galactosidase [bacterium]
MTIKPMQAAVQNYHGRPTIFINEEPYSPMIYSLTDQPGGRWSTDEIPQLNIKLFAEQGVKLVQLDLPFEYMWREDNTLDLTRAKKQIQGVLEVCPDAGIFFRLHVNAPKWWIEKHPEEKVKYDGVAAKPDPESAKRRLLEHDAGLADRFSLASKKWRDSATEMLKKFCCEFAATPESHHLVGIQVACGVYGEWHYWGFMHWEPDFGAPMQQHFREWVQAKYTNTDTLRRVWNDPAIDFGTVAVPKTTERAATSAGVFRDPQKEQKVIDYYTCQHELVRDNVLHFCRIVKENWPRPIITGSFYGYFFSVFNRLAAGSQL